MLEIGERPWGKYYVLADEPNYKLKRIEVNPGQKLSYQYHHKRQEQWTVIEGDATVVLDEKEIKLNIEYDPTSDPYTDFKDFIEYLIYKNIY